MNKQLPVIVRPVQVRIERTTLNASYFVLVLSIALVLAFWARHSISPKIPTALMQAVSGSKDDVGAALYKASVVHPGEETILLLGNSVVVQGLDGDSVLTTGFQNIVENRDNKFTCLCFSAQPLWNSLQLVDKAALSPKHEVVLFLSPWALSVPPAEHLKRQLRFVNAGGVSSERLLKFDFLRSGPFDWWRAHVSSEMPFRIKYALKKYVNEYIYSANLYEFNRHPSKQREFSAGRRDANWQRFVALDQQQISRDYPLYADSNQELLEEIVKIVTQTGASLRIYLTPLLNEDTRDELYGEAWNDFRIRLDYITDRYDVGIFDLNSQITFTRDDFNDPVHLNAKGRAKFSEAFLHSIAASRLAP